MANFAEIDKEGKVLRIIVIANSELLVDGVEDEQKGIEFCKKLLGEKTNWVQTSYNAKFRKKYAIIGDFYDKQKDEFITIE